MNTPDHGVDHDLARAATRIELVAVAIAALFGAVYMVGHALGRW